MKLSEDLKKRIAAKSAPPPVRMAHGGATCPACGYALGGEVEPDDDDADEVPSNLDETSSDPEEERKRFISAIRSRDQ